MARDHQVYGLTLIRGIQDPDIRVCWRLEKKSDLDKVYDVAVHAHGGTSCTCPDWETRYYDFNTAGCKHIKGLVALGLIEAPRPVAVTVREVAPSIPGVTRVRDEFDEPAGDDLPAGIRVVDPARIPADPIPPEQVGPETPPPAAPEAAPAPDPEPEAPAAGWTLPAEDPEDDQADPDWSPEDRIALGPAPTPQPSGLSLIEYVRGEAAGYRHLGGAGAILIAEAIEALASDLALTGATTPEQHRDRMDALAESYAGR
jgi:hypothetical protein